MILVDNKSGIQLTKNPVHHGRSKHINTRFYFLRDYVKLKTVELEYCHTTKQIANIFTKLLPADAFRRLRYKIGMTTLQI